MRSLYRINLWLPMKWNSASRQLAWREMAAKTRRQIEPHIQPKGTNIKFEKVKMYPQQKPFVSKTPSWIHESEIDVRNKGKQHSDQIIIDMYDTQKTCSIDFSSWPSLPWSMVWAVGWTYTTCWALLDSLFGVLEAASSTLRSMCDPRRKKEGKCWISPSNVWYQT